MTMPPPEDIVTFMQVTRVPEYVAVQKLQEHRGNLTDAINAYFVEVERHRVCMILAETRFSGPSSSNVTEAQREEQMIQAAMEALSTMSQGKEMDTGEGSSSQQMGILKDSSDGGLPQRHSPQEEDNDLALARAIWTSLKDNANDDLEPLPADVINRLNSIIEDEKEELTKKILRDLAKRANVITIGVRMPSGSRIDRIFTKNDTLKELFEFVDIVGFHEVKSGRYRLVKHFPRRAYSVEDGSSTFEEVGLTENIALYIEKI